MPGAVQAIVAICHHEKLIASVNPDQLSGWRGAHACGRSGSGGSTDVIGEWIENEIPGAVP